MKTLTAALLVLLCIHLVMKSSAPINEDHLRGFKGSRRRKPVQLHRPVAYDVGFDGATHESRPDEVADFCPYDPIIKERHADCTPG